MIKQFKVKENPVTKIREILDLKGIVYNKIIENKN